MNILPATGGDPIGAAALLNHANPAELERFTALEDAVWGKTTLSPAVTEAVRLHCAQIRGCAFCSAVRVSAAIEDGLSEAHIANLGTADLRDWCSTEQAAALMLVDLYLRNPQQPGDEQRARICAALGTSGVMEVLLACCAFASADLRIALGENLEPQGSGVVERARGELALQKVGASWPALDGSVLDPATTLPAVAAAVAAPIHERIAALWSGTDMPPKLVAACAVRSAQLLGVDSADPVMGFLVPPLAAQLVEAEGVRGWPQWSAAQGRDELALAEQLWVDPAGVDESIIEPLLAARGTDGLIRVAWSLILIGQLHRAALVLHGSPSRNAEMRT